MEMDEIIDEEGEEIDIDRLLHNALLTNAVLIKRLDGRVSITRQEWEEAKAFNMKVEIRDDHMVVTLVKTSQESIDVH